MTDDANADAIRHTAARRATTDAALLIAILAIALVLRVIAIDASPSADELWHLGLSRGLGSPVGIYPAGVPIVDAPSIATLDGAAPAWQIWTHMDGVLHPPLYVVTLRLWRDVFGSGLLAAHALSIVSSLVAIAFAFDAARLAMGRVAAVCASLLVAVAPIQIYFAQEIRGYQMMIAIGSAMLWLATRIEVLGPTPRRAATLGLMALPLLLTHYFAAGGALGIAIYAIVRLRGRPLVAFLVAIATAGAIYVVAWFPFAFRQIASLHTGDAFAKVPEVDLLREIRWAVSIPARLFLERPWFSGIIGNLSGAAVGLLILAAPWPLRRRLSAIFPWACWLTASIATLVFLDLARSTFLVMLIRYAAVVSPAVALLVVAILHARSSRTMVVGTTLALAAMLIVRPADGGIVADAPNYGPIARWLAEHIQPGDAVMVIEGTTGEHNADLALLTLAHEPGLFPRIVVKTIDPLTNDALRRLPDRAWVVMIDPDVDRTSRVLGPAEPIERHDFADGSVCASYDLSELKRGAIDAIVP